MEGGVTSGVRGWKEMCEGMEGGVTSGVRGWKEM